MEHLISRIDVPPAPSGSWDAAVWRSIPALHVGDFHPRSSAHRPVVDVRLAHSDSALHALFRVKDRFVRAARTAYGEMVCRDSCIEIFLQPKTDGGYFNFETSCGGTMLIWMINDPTPGPKGPSGRVIVSEEDAREIGVFHSLPKHIPEEITEPTEWVVELSIPVSLMEKYVGKIGKLSGQEWRGNLFKCADETSHPHWASWNPIGEKLYFHQPERFGILRFE